MEFKIENTQVFGLENAARASGNPMRTEIQQEYIEQDLARLGKLAQTGVGEGHDQALTGVIVQFDLYAPLYMWKQLQRYHWLDFISSQSTMHRLTKFNVADNCVVDTDEVILKRYQELLDEYAIMRSGEEYSVPHERALWRKLVASLPCGFVLGATMTTNYRQLKTMYHQRKNHKLKEWHDFCHWVEQLPHSELITGGEKHE